MATLLQLLVIVSLLVISMGARIRRSELFSINLQNTNNHGPTNCTIDNRAGICVHESACDEEHRVWDGGVVDQYNFRSVKQCPFGYWCCYNGTIPDIHTTDRQMTGEQTTDRQTTDIQTTDTQTTDTQTTDTQTTDTQTTDTQTTDTQTTDIQPTYIQTTDRQTTDRQPTDRQTTEGAYTTVKTKNCAVGDDCTNNSNYCLAPQTDVCPWCVLLYHSSSGYQNAQHPFCLGALVGSKAIITASTCLTTAKNKMLYAQLPNSSHPGKNYTILERLFHPNYDTGSHRHDIGLLFMESDETLQEAQGACLDFVRPLKGVCVGYGFDINWKMYSTILQVTDSSCGKAGNSTDAACGTNEDAVCLVEFGGPILCPADPKGGLVLQGIARGICRADKVTLGRIAPSDRWIENELASKDIPRDSYIL